MSDATQQRALRFITEALGQGNRAAFDELVHPDITVHSGLSPLRPIRGAQAYWQTLGQLAAFEFQDFDLRDVLATGDRAVAQFRAHALHVGDQLGVPATRQRILMWEIHLMRWSEGRLVENVVADVNYDWPWLVQAAYPGAIGKTGSLEA
jgi:predicted ester cyclase